MEQSKLPMIELHLHLDGAIPPETMWALAQEKGVPMPAETLEGFQHWLVETSDCADVNTYLARFELPLQLMQDAPSIARVTKDLMTELSRQGHIYDEIRFAPQLHRREGLTQRQAIEAVLEGRRQALAENPGYDAGILLCAMCIGPETVNMAENLETARNLYLAQSTGARLHMCHVSTKEALADILAAKARGVRVTCEVTPHHIWFWDSDFRVNPPIRAKEDVEALIAAMLRGEVEAIATDHAPHTEEDKRGGAPGMVGLETAFSVCYTKLCREYGMPLADLSRLMSRGPAEILGLNKGLIAEGYDGDVVLVELGEPYTVRREDFAGKSKNTPYDGLSLYGRVACTVKAGRVTYGTMEAIG